MRPRLLSRDSADIVSATYFSLFLLDKTFYSHQKCILETWVSNWKTIFRQLCFFPSKLPAQLNQYNRCRMLRKWSSACTYPIQSTTLSWGEFPFQEQALENIRSHRMQKRGIRNYCASKMLTIPQRFHSKRKLMLRICRHHWMQPNDHISEQPTRTNAHN